MPTANKLAINRQKVESSSGIVIEKKGLIKNSLNSGSLSALGSARALPGAKDHSNESHPLSSTSNELNFSVSVVDVQQNYQSSRQLRLTTRLYLCCTVTCNTIKFMQCISNLCIIVSEFM